LDSSVLTGKVATIDINVSVSYEKIEVVWKDVIFPVGLAGVRVGIKVNFTFIFF